MSVSRVKISKLAKLLNRILLLEGLEQVAGSREENMEVELKKDNGWWVVVVVVVLHHRNHGGDHQLASCNGYDVEAHQSLGRQNSANEG